MASLAVLARTENSRVGRAAAALPGAGQWSLTRQFLVGHFAIVLLGVLLTGAWIGNQIEASVLDRTASVTNLYVNSVIGPRLQSLARSAWLTPAEIGDLDHLITDTPLGQGVVVFKIWSPDGHVLYSRDRSLIGRQFPRDEKFMRSATGQVVADVSNLTDDENEDERGQWSHLIEVYAPVLRDGDGQLIAINEFYMLPDELDAQIGAARLRAWIIAGGIGALLYLFTIGIVKRGSDTIERQRGRLQQQVKELAVLHQRVLQAASRTTALNEQALRRISADLHDGPGQVLALAMLRLDSLRAPCGDQSDFGVVREAVSDALKDVRAISSGLRLPELEPVPMSEAVERVVVDHERRSDTPVHTSIEALPGATPLAIKIAVVRTLQEALSNATRHASGVDVAVRLWTDAERLWLEVADGGPGFDPSAVNDSERRHLGLAGMRERAELLGGSFSVLSSHGGGTKVQAWWPLVDQVAA
jgi:signal transduction histidine kinase